MESKGHQRFAYWVLAISLCLTLAGWYVLQRNLDHEARLKFEFDCKYVQARIVQQIENYTDMLRGAQGLFAASQSVSVSEWTAYAQKLPLSRKYSGVMAMAYVEKVELKDLAAFTQSIRDDSSFSAAGYPRFEIRPEPQNDPSFVATYAEPIQNNSKLFGFDLGSEPRRRETLMRAMETALPAISGKIELVQSPDMNAGFIVALPIYENGASISNPEDKKSNLKGFVVAAIRAYDLFSGVFEDFGYRSTIDFEVFAGTETTLESVLYDHDRSLHAIDPQYKARFRSDVPIEVEGTTFTVHFTAPTNYGLGGVRERYTWAALAGGIAISLLFFFLVRTVAFSATKAKRFAEEKTRDLREEIAHRKMNEAEIENKAQEIQLLLESSTDGIYGIDLDGLCTFINKSALRMLGYHQDEVLGKDMHHLAHHKKPNGDPYPIEDCPIYQAFKSGTACRVEDEVLWRKDGTVVFVTYSTSPILRGGKTVGSVCSFSDTTIDQARRWERQQLLAEMEAQKRALDRFAVISETDPDGTIIYVNDYFCQVSKYSRKELMGQKHRIVNSGLHPKSFFKEMWTTIGAGKVWHGEVRNRSKDGGFQWADTTIVPLMSSSGHPIKHIAFRFLITDRKKAEADLAESRERLTIATRGALIGVWDWDVAQNKLVWDESMYRLYGILQGQGSTPYDTWKSALHPDDVERAQKELQQALRGEKEFDTEFKIFWPDGSIRHIRAIASVRRDSDGKPFAMVGVNYDVTEIRRAQEALMKLNSFQESVLKNAGSSVIATTAEGVITHFNPTAEKMLGYAAAEIVGIQTPKIFHDKDEVGRRAGEFGEELGERIEPGFEVLVAKARRNLPNTYEWTYIRKDGGRIAVLLSVAALRDSAEKIFGFVGIATDITERKRMGEKIAEAVAVKGEFISMVSHELRTPLTVIKEGIGLVADGTLGALNADQSDYLNLAQRNTDRLARLINDVLDYQKLDAGQMIMKTAQYDLNEVIRENLPTFASLAAQRGLTVKTELAHEILPLNFDKDKIVQVLMNFVGNAVKFTDKGHVTIRTTYEGNAVHVAVVDNGIGIKEEDQHKLFTSFSQIHNDGIHKTGGTGLGLAISKRIIEMHRGRIGATSAWGHGATFYFTLPIVERIK